MNPIITGLIGVAAIAVGLSLVAALGFCVLRLLGCPIPVHEPGDDAGTYFDLFVCCVLAGFGAICGVALAVGISYEAGRAVLHLWGRA